MNKKLIIILSASIIVTIMFVIGILYFVNQSNIKKPIVTDTKNTEASEYVIEKGLEKMAKIVKPAVESYASQDIAESTAARNARLSAYFAPKSPVFNREIEIRSTNSANKTTASVTSINSSNAEGQYPMLIVKTDLISILGNNKNTTSQKYWITIIKNVDGSYIANDIGIWLL